MVLPVSSKTLRNQIRQCTSKSQIEKAEIAYNHPSNCENSEAIRPNVADQHGNGKQGYAHGRDLPNQIPNRIASQQ